MSPVKKFIEIDIPAPIRLLSEVFSIEGHQLFLVGGAVRDSLLGQEPKDFDVATDAHPDRIIEIVRKHLQLVTILDIGKAFGVIKIVFHSDSDDVFECEIATFRVDLSGGRRPEAVQFSTIEEDVKRRDLTINALFWDINTREVVDFVGGLDDLKNNIVRTVGRPEDRFAEDRLRILRAVRFAAWLGHDMHPDTEDAIISSPSLVGVSPERIREEFLKGLSKSHSVTHFLTLIDRLGLWPEVLPGLEVRRDMVREIRHSGILLALLLRNNSVGYGLMNVENILHKLKYTSDEIKQVMFLSNFTYLSLQNAVKLKKAFNTSKLTQQEVETFASIMRLGTAWVSAFFKFEPSELAISLMSEGFTGKELGIELERRETVNFSRTLDAETKNKDTD